MVNLAGMNSIGFGDTEAEWAVTSVGLVGGIVAILTAIWFYCYIRSIEVQSKEVEQLRQRIADGAKAFLHTEYTYLIGFCIVMAIALAVILIGDEDEEEQYDGVHTAICFFVGAALSALAGYMGMLIATEANARTCQACTTGTMKTGLEVSFASGAVMSNFVVGFGILGVAVMFIFYSHSNNGWNYISGFGFGASSIALFARVGGGIFTKAADVGADLVGKVENGIPEDDPRNPGVIADNVGDNVGDVAGMGADLFESFVGSIIAAATLSVSEFADSANSTQSYDVRLMTNPQIAAVALPFWVAGFGIIVALVGIFIIRKFPLPDDANLGRLLHQINYGIYTSAVLVLGTSILSTQVLFPGEAGWRFFGCIAIGLVAGLIIGNFTEYCTSYETAPTRGISASSKAGAAPVIIMGLGVGMMSVTVPTIVLGATILACNEIAGLYGISIAAVGLLSTLGVTLATDAYGPVADNAGGIAEMAKLPGEVRNKTDALDSLGNTTAATGKGFAIGSAVLTSVGLIAAFNTQSGLVDLVDGQYAAVTGALVVDVRNPVVLTGVLIGAMLPFVFAALTMLSVNTAANAIIDEVRRQFALAPELFEDEELDFVQVSKVVNERTRTTRRFEEGTQLGADEKVMQFPDSQICVSIATRSAIDEMVLPGMLAVFSPVIIGFLLGVVGLSGMLVGSLTSGFMLALTMSNAGGAWDNAKKWVEKCASEGEPLAHGSDAVTFVTYGIKKESQLVSGGKAAVTGDALKAYYEGDATVGATDDAIAARAQELASLYHDRHSAVVTGDTVGDPFKDTSGPALNILIKLMSVVSLVLAPAFDALDEREGFGDNGWWIALIIAVLLAIVCLITTSMITKGNNARAAEAEQWMKATRAQLARQKEAEAAAAAAAAAAAPADGAAAAAAAGDEEEGAGAAAAAEEGDKAEAQPDAVAVDAGPAAAAAEEGEAAPAAEDTPAEETAAAEEA